MTHTRLQLSRRERLHTDPAEVRLMPPTHVPDVVHYDVSALTERDGSNSISVAGELGVGTSETTAVDHRNGVFHARLAVAIVVMVFAVLIVGTGIGLARADDTPSTPDTAPTDKIGVLTISHVTADGAPVENSVIQFKRVNDTTTTTSRATADPSESPTPTSTTPSATESSADSPSASASPTPQPSSLRLPIGTTFDLITGTEPIVLAVPEGDYTLTQLGVVATDTNGETGPTAEETTVHVTAGTQVDGKLTNRKSTTPPASTEPVPAN
ncbi:hypothetical protein [Gordonia sp. OPL2]|uniref:hypothetical protein n=1 Tax=Gordonia sp. OPL2 TaxID=2486274 RepID=UPI001656387F|nr:hypothetical protein [Gordonia sp. OPL2]